MPEAPEPQGTPRRPYKEYEDPHFHDEDEVTSSPNDETPRPALPRRPPPRKLPPPPRRFHED
jgi:hypothetical protein